MCDTPGLTCPLATYTTQVPGPAPGLPPFSPHHRRLLSWRIRKLLHVQSACIRCLQHVCMLSAANMKTGGNVPSGVVSWVGLRMFLSQQIARAGSLCHPASRTSLLPWLLSSLLMLCPAVQRCFQRFHSRQTATMPSMNGPKWPRKQADDDIITNHWRRMVAPVPQHNTEHVSKQDSILIAAHAPASPCPLHLLAGGVDVEAGAQRHWGRCSPLFELHW